MMHRQKDGQLIRISDMTDSHLKNTINMYLRIAEKGITLTHIYADPFGQDHFYDPETLTGNEALEELNFSAYEKEALKRGIIIHKTGEMK